jgi:acyl transferase domain-containing protein
VLNPNIDFSQTPFVVQQELAPWPRPVLDINGVTREYSRIAGISSFGAGGANAHVVIEEYRASVEAAFVSNGPAIGRAVGAHADRLHEQVQQLLAAMASDPDIALADLAYTLQVGREAMEERLALLVNSLDELREKLGAYARVRRRSKSCIAGRSSAIRMRWPHWSATTTWPLRSKRGSPRANTASCWIYG